MIDNRVQAEATGAERSLTPDEATPPLCPVPMPRQVIVFWTPRLALVEALQAMKVFVLKSLRYQERVYQRVPMTLPNRNNDRR
jgi:hypothetical protein